MLRVLRERCHVSAFDPKDIAKLVAGAWLDLESVEFRHPCSHCKHDAACFKDALALTLSLKPYLRLLPNCTARVLMATQLPE